VSAATGGSELQYSKQKTMKHGIVVFKLLVFCAAASVRSTATSTCPLILDVRTLSEWNQGHVSCAKRIESGTLLTSVVRCMTTNDTAYDIRVYCRSGARAGVARSALLSEGFTNVTNAGGYVVGSAGAVLEPLCPCANPLFSSCLSTATGSASRLPARQAWAAWATPTAVAFYLAQAAQRGGRRL
jgi:phage shock protein E